MAGLSSLPSDDDAGDLSVISSVDLAVSGSMLASATKLISWKNFQDE